MEMKAGEIYHLPNGAWAYVREAIWNENHDFSQGERCWLSQGGYIEIVEVNGLTVKAVYINPFIEKFGGTEAPNNAAVRFDNAGKRSADYILMSKEEMKAVIKSRKEASEKADLPKDYLSGEKEEDIIRILGIMQINELRRIKRQNEEIIGLLKSITPR